MSPHNSKNSRFVSLIKLRLPYEKGDEPLTDAEVRTLTHQGLLRSAHYLWLAEQHIMDLSKIVDNHELDKHLEAITNAGAYLNELVSGLFKER